MIDPIMSYAGVMRVEINRMNSIAHNASNSNTAGFLQEKTYVDKEQFKNIILNQPVEQKYHITPDQKLGALHLTQKSLDVGINSNDWFQLESNEKILVTRNGHFSLSEDGTLYLGESKVLGTNGSISNLKPGFTVHADGSIYSGKDLIDKIKMVSVPDSAELTSVGNGVYESSLNVQEAKNPQVVQGALSSSNVDIQNDMTKIIEMSRHIEMVQRAMTAYSSILDVGINQIGK